MKRSNPNWMSAGAFLAVLLLAGPAGALGEEAAADITPAPDFAGETPAPAEHWDPFAWMEEFRREMEGAFDRRGDLFRRWPGRAAEPFGWLEGFQEEMDRFFELSRSPWHPDDFARIELDWEPRVDIREGEKEVVVRVDLPGVGRENLDVTVEGNLLTVAGERKEEKEVSEDGYRSIERSYGSFRRTVTLPPTADTENPSSSYEDGVLEIRFLRREPPEPRKLKLI